MVGARSSTHATAARFTRSTYNRQPMPSPRTFVVPLSPGRSLRGPKARSYYPGLHVSTLRYDLSRGCRKPHQPAPALYQATVRIDIGAQSQHRLAAVPARKRKSCQRRQHHGRGNGRRNDDDRRFETPGNMTLRRQAEEVLL